VVCTLLDDWDWMRKGKAYVFQTDEGLSVKLFETIIDGMVYISSDNTSYNTVSPMALDSIRQVYAVEYKIERG
jgi:phage repressor protein C with HTH and peptisase S24 domain